MTVLTPGDIAIVHVRHEHGRVLVRFSARHRSRHDRQFHRQWLARRRRVPLRRRHGHVHGIVRDRGRARVITLSGLDLDEAGDQIIAYQGDPATPTILHLVDFADGNNTVAGDATDDNTTALPPGFTLGVNAVAVAFDNSIYAGPISGSPEGLFAALNNSANWLDGDALPVAVHLQREADTSISTPTIRRQRATTTRQTVTSGGPAVPVADTDIDDQTTTTAPTFSPPRSGSSARSPGPARRSTARCRSESWRRHSVRRTGILRLEGQASHAAYEAAIRQMGFSTTDTPGERRVSRSGYSTATGWSNEAHGYSSM